MARNNEVPSPVFDIQQYVGPVNLPPLTIQEEPKPDQSTPESFTPPAATPVYESPMASQPEQQTAAPASVPVGAQPPSSLRPIVPASFEAVSAWRQNDAMLREIARPRPPLPRQTLTASRGLFETPLLGAAPERPALPAAPAPEIPKPTEEKAGHHRKEAKKKLETSEDAETTTPPHLIEIIKKHKRASAVALVAMTALAGLGLKTSGDGSPDISANATQVSVQHPEIRNEAFNCSSPLVNMIFNGSAVATIPVTLQEAGHTNSYLEFDVKGSASSLAKICGIRKNQQGQTLATYNKKSNKYSFDRSRVQIDAGENTFNASGITAMLTAFYVDGKPVAANQVSKYPYDAKTAKLLTTLLTSDPKTKSIVIQPTLQRYIRVKMEKEGLAALKNPEQCSNTQGAFDQVVSSYINSQFARKNPNATKTGNVSAVGKNQYGDMVTAFMSDKDTASFANSGVVKLSGFALSACDATPYQPTAAPKPSATKKG